MRRFLNILWTCRQKSISVHSKKPWPRKAPKPNPKCLYWGSLAVWNTKSPFKYDNKYAVACSHLGSSSDVPSSHLESVVTISLINKEDTASKKTARINPHLLQASHCDWPTWARQIAATTEQTCWCHSLANPPLGTRPNNAPDRDRAGMNLCYSRRNILTAVIWWRHRAAAANAFSLRRAGVR